MLYFKSCPKCRGDMYLDNDSYGSFRQCLQCGLVQDIITKPMAVPQPIEEKARKRRVSVKAKMAA